MIEKLKSIIEKFRAGDVEPAPTTKTDIFQTEEESTAVRSARIAQEAIGKPTFYDGTKSDIELVAGQGHVLAVQLTNHIRRRAVFAPTKALAVACLASTAIVFAPHVASLTIDNEVEHTKGWLRELIAFDPTAAITLPDGTAAHARYAKLSNLPPAKVGMADIKPFADGFQTNLAAYAKVRAHQADKVKAVEDISGGEIELGPFNSRVWNAWLKLKSTPAPTIESDIPLVAAKGLWKNQEALDAMAKTGVIARDGDNLLAAAYVNGVLSMNAITNNGCQNIVGAKLEEDCARIDGEQEVPSIIAATFEDLPEVSAEVAATSIVPDRWYLDLPTSDESHSIPPYALEVAAQIQIANSQAGGISWNSRVWNMVATLEQPPVIGSAKGLWKNAVAIDAMKFQPVIAKTEVDGQFVVAGFVDGKPAAQIHDVGNCITIFGEDSRDCAMGDVSSFEKAIRSMYEPGVETAALEPMTFYQTAPFRGEGILDGDGYFTLFNAVLNDFARHGGSREALAKWTISKDLPEAIHIARPTEFFSKEANVAALSKGGAVIIPEDIENTYALAAHVDGKLVLSIIEIEGRGFNCRAVFGGEAIRECQLGDLSQYEGLLKSMFEQETHD